MYELIENYGVIGDLNTVALVSLKGSIDFMSFPDFDSPTIFAALLDDKKGGRFLVSPQYEEMKTKQLYLPDTNVLLTRFLSAEGMSEITDFMPVEELYEGHELIRRVTNIRGEAHYKMLCMPRFNYGKSKHRAEQVSPYEIIFESTGTDKTKLRLISTVKMSLKDKDAIANFSLKANERADFLLVPVEREEIHRKDITSFVTENLFRTLNYWKKWVGQSTYNGRWREVVNRSALVLKLLTSYKYGSILAAPTFGLPERIGGKRNWDYRYAWIRDASFTVYALIRLGYTKEAGAFMNWIEKRCSDIRGQKPLGIMYSMDGTRQLEEKILDHFEGYKKSGPVRVGNDAYTQTQLDIYGELIDAVFLYDKHGEPVAYDLWNDLKKQMEWLAENWNKPDEGIWEVRAGKKEFLYSRLSSWVAFDRIIKIAEHRSFPIDSNWRVQRDKIYNSIYSDFWNKKQKAFVQYKGAENVDASALLMPLLRFISPKDPKWLSTMKKIEKDLASDALVYRYRMGKSAPDGLPGHEGTFSMCTFWYVECLSLAGQLQKARLYFEKMIGYGNHLGLFSEQLGFKGEHLGNFPQAFTHLGLISAAYSLDRQLNNSRNKSVNESDL